jgi:LPS O-antigen subunit length determinant protein (WzzB/FepE family)
MNKYLQNTTDVEHDLVEDEIDLGWLFQWLWEQKKTIFAVVIMCLVIAAAYLLLVTPIYQVQSVLRPATIKELDAMAQDCSPMKYG